MEKKAPLSKILLCIAAAVVAVALFTALVLWTLAVVGSRRMEDLRNQVARIGEEGGPAAVLALGGYDVENIFQGEEGLVLFQDGGGASWRYSADELQDISAYSKASVSVVEIYLPERLSSAAGCGVVISSDGYIVTARHVIEGGSSFRIRFLDGRQADARLVGSDSVTDIAVIQVEGDVSCEPISFQSAEDLVIGQKVLAIGSPYGYSWSLSSGLVSGLDRTVTSSSGVSLSGLIQSDAAVNPGNSGGPLIDSHGAMVGLVTAIYSTTGSAQGVSFAIPVDLVIDVASDIIRDGEVSRGTLDISALELNVTIADYLGLPVSQGMLVSQVIPGGECERAGMQGGTQLVQYGSSVVYLGGDVITAIDGVAINGYDDYYAFMASTNPGQRVDVTVLRAGEESTLRGVPLVKQTAENMRLVGR